MGWPTGDALREIVAPDEFHHERGDALALLEAVDGSDVRMVQRGEDFGFPLKPGKPITVSGQEGRQDLDGHLTFQLGIGGPIHLPHAAFAKERCDLIDAEAGAGS